MSKKPIIAFEGIEASGKSHHISVVSKILKKKKIPFILLREPGGNKNSEKIRKLILKDDSNFDKITDLLLYLAARNENVNSIIKKYFKKKIILIDRFVDSTIAYQHYGMGININIIRYLNKFLLKNIKVDFTFLHLINKKNLQLRLKKRNKLNRYDKFDLNFYKKVQNGFIKISKVKKKSYLNIDSNLDIEINEKIIKKKINQLIK